jgi:predicted nucleic acid-binding protein
VILYLDTSALLKRYVQEVGTTWLAVQCDPTMRNPLVTALITKVEAAAGLAGKFRHGGLSQAEYLKIEQDLLYDFTRVYRLIEIRRPLIDLAVVLARRQKLRGYDAVQLATALTLNDVLVQSHLPPLTFLTADATLFQAALQEGLRVDNPNLHP